MNLDSSPGKLTTLQTDLDTIPSIARSSQKRVIPKEYQIKLSDV